MFKPAKIVVVGGNAAGPAAAAKAKRVNPGAKVIMFEAGEFISTGTCEIPYVLSGDIQDYKELITYTPNRFREEKNVEVYINCEVIRINRQKKSVTVYNNKEKKEFEENYDSLILAAGSIPKPVSDFPEFAVNLFTLKNINDLIRINDFIKSKEINSVVIIGAGYIGLEAADAFHTTGKDVILVERENLPLPYTEPEIQMLILQLLKKSNILFCGSAEKLIPGIHNGIIHSININGRIVEPDIVISAAGVVPNTLLARDAGLEISPIGGIKVDRKLRTSDPYIWVCGDSIGFLNEVTGQIDYFPLATIAHDYAHIAGENAAGGNAIAFPVVKNIAVKILNRFQVSVGITSREARVHGIPFKSVESTAFNLVKVMPGSEQIYGKIIYHAVNKNLLGGAFFGGREVSGYGDLISAFIRNKIPGNVLGELNYNYTPPLSPFINLLSILGRKIK